MAAFTVELDVHAPPDRVFAVFSDFRNLAKNIAGVQRAEVLTEGEIGAGTRFRETRIMFKKEATEEMEITEWDPPRSYVVECDSCGAHYRSEFRFEPLPVSDGPGGTKVVLSFTCKPLTFAAKLMSPLGIVFACSIKKAMLADMEDLKKVAEEVVEG
ncbi:MAG: SRPBCC family protein [Planctomycetes bacterium]|nr:SRPBCC family protein [Planctomycetota bacterium]NOG54417.1 SRPBCC family protein [Planctomycetota bacterium]